MEAKWVCVTNDNIPEDAFVGGSENGELLIIGRARYGDELLPGKVIRSHSCCFFTWDKEERQLSEYEVLVDFKGKWIPSTSKKVQQRAVEAGKSSLGTTFYIGRVELDNCGLVVGRVDLTNNTCYVPYYGEIASDKFEILCHPVKPTTKSLGTGILNGLKNFIFQL
ncbi:unnamed protein product [Diamesa serratosioi]